jgi:phage terminase small subunit
MNERHRRFVAAYRVSRNATQSALKAGVSPASASATGQKLLRDPEIIAALKAVGVEIVYGTNPPGQKRAPRRPFVKRGLTLRQQRFVAEYLKDGNATKAAIRAGLKSKNPAYAGNKMKRRAGVAEAIAKGRAEIAQELHVDAARVIEEYARLAFADLRDYVEWGPKGVTLKPQSEIGKAASPAIIELVARKDKRGTRMKVKLHSKLKSLEALGKYLGIFARANASKAIRAASVQRTPGEDAAARLRALAKRS